MSTEACTPKRGFINAAISIWSN